MRPRLSLLSGPLWSWLLLGGCPLLLILTCSLGATITVESTTEELEEKGKDRQKKSRERDA